MAFRFDGMVDKPVKETTNLYAETLGQTIENALRGGSIVNMEISKLKALGIDIDSQEYANWLHRYNLRQVRGRKNITFVLAPTLPADLQAAIERWKSEQDE